MDMVVILILIQTFADDDKNLFPIATKKKKRIKEKTHTYAHMSYIFTLMSNLWKMKIKYFCTLYTH